MPLDEILGFVLLSHMKDHLIPRRMQFSASQYLFSFQIYKGLMMAKSAKFAGH